MLGGEIAQLIITAGGGGGRLLNWSLRGVGWGGGGGVNGLTENVENKKPENVETLDFVKKSMYH